MEKYYYVKMSNKTSCYDERGEYINTATYEQIKDIATHTSIGFSEPCALALRKIKKVRRSRTVLGFWGFEKTETYDDYDSFFVICEKKKDYFEEIITGKKYPIINDNDHSGYYSSLRLETVREIPAYKVAEMLQTLSEEEIHRFKTELYKLDSAISVGYQMDMKRIKNQLTREQNDQAYIKSFKNRYGK